MELLSDCPISFQPVPCWLVYGPLQSCAGTEFANKTNEIGEINRATGVAVGAINMSRLGITLMVLASIPPVLFGVAAMLLGPDDSDWPLISIVGEIAMVSPIFLIG